MDKVDAAIYLQKAQSQMKPGKDNPKCVKGGGLKVFVNQKKNIVG